MKKLNLPTPKINHPIINLERKKKKRKGGAWKGKVTIAKDFDILPDEFMRYFTSKLL